MHRTQRAEHVHEPGAITAGTPHQRSIPRVWAHLGIKAVGKLVVYNYSTGADALIRLNNGQRYPLSSGGVLKFFADEAPPDASGEVVQGVGPIFHYDVDSADGSTNLSAGMRIIESDWRANHHD